jgi:hypothetical protein
MAEFADLRAHVPIERMFTEMLGVTDFKPAGSKQRVGTCPLCGKTALKITPSMGLCNCFGKGCQLGGDIIKALARVRKLSISDAGNAIAAHFGVESARPAQHARPTPTFDALAYQARLDPEHEALACLKLSSGIIREFGGGYCGKGKLGGHLALPIYEGDTIVSFFGISVEDNKPWLKFARDQDEAAIFNANRLVEGEMLTVTTHPLSVLRAVENGDTQTVAIFTPYTPDALRRIAALMDRLKIEDAELF